MIAPPMMKQELKTLSSQNRDGTLMFPGKVVFTWIRVHSVWMLLSIEPYKAAA